MSTTERLVEVGTFIYQNGPMILGVGMILAFGYFCWMKSIKGILISGLGLITTLVLGW